jgi:hypothetical protein
VIEAHVAMHRDARAEGMTFVELRLREAFKHAYRVTLTEFHEDVPKRSDCCPTVGKQTPTNRYGVGVRLEGCGCYKRVRNSSRQRTRLAIPRPRATDFSIRGAGGRSSQ